MVPITERSTKELQKDQHTICIDIIPLVARHMCIPLSPKYFDCHLLPYFFTFNVPYLPPVLEVV